MDTMTTLSEITNILKDKGYNIDFNLKESCIECSGNYLKIFPGEFVIDKHYCFEDYQTPLMKQLYMLFLHLNTI